MKTLVLYGEPQPEDHKMIQLLQKISMKQIYIITSDEVTMPIHHPTLIVIKHNHLHSIHLTHGAVLFQPQANLDRLQHLSQEMTCIIETSNPEHRQFVSKTSGRVITFGFSNTDTLTFSSRSEEDAVVCLQRSILTLDHTVIEPMEIPCRFEKNHSDREILAIISMALVTNMLPPMLEQPLIF